MHCDHKGYQQAQNMLMKGTMVTCQACCEVLSSCGFVMEDLEKMILEQMASDDPEEGPVPDKNPLLQNVPDEDAPDEVIWAWVDSLKPNIVLLEPGTFGKKVPYQCTHCRSKRWPEGRVGDCSRYHAKSIRHFLVQHIGSGMHYKAVVFNQPQQLVPHVPCEGLCVNVKETAGILYEYQHEFAIWAGMANFSLYASHSYWRECNQDRWCIRAQSCLKETEAVPGRARQVCAQCVLLGGAHGPVRSVLRFAEKYWAAKILNTRIFQGKDATAELEKEVQTTVSCSPQFVFHCVISLLFF